MPSSLLYGSVSTGVRQLFIYGQLPFTTLMHYSYVSAITLGSAVALCWPLDWVAIATGPATSNSLANQQPLVSDRSLLFTGGPMLQKCLFLTFSLK